MHAYKGGDQGYCIQTKPLLVVEGSSEVTGVDFKEATSLTSALAPVKSILVLPTKRAWLSTICTHLKRSCGLLRKGINSCVSPLVGVSFLRKSSDFINVRTDSSRLVESGRRC